MDREEQAMRQRSIAGPVILIGIGILFLLNNLRPDFSFLGELLALLALSF